MMRKRDFHIRIMGWSLATLAALGLFPYLTFVPNPTFAIDTADPNETRTLMGINTMQEMTAQICANTKENRTKRLKDERDGKYYWVAKLRDGNCWMTQNLDYDDINSTRIAKPSEWVSSTVGYTSQAYYDVGMFSYSDALPGKTCTTTVGMEECIEQGWIDVREWSVLNEISDIIIDDSSESYDAHYLIGNLYSWPSVTNGSGNAIGDGNAALSICPGNWRLPISNSTSNGSFHYLLSLYGMSSKPVNGQETIYGYPLYFLASGQIDGGRIERTSDVLLWSSTGSSANSNHTAKNLGVYNNVVYPSDLWNRSYGLPARCLVVGGWLPDGGLEDGITSSSDSVNIAIKVSPVLNLEVIESAEGMEVDFNSIDKKTININVAANEKYRITLSTEQPNLLPQDREKNTKYIQMVGTEGGIVAKGKTGWGIKKKKSATDDNELGSLDDEEDYSSVGIDKEQITFYRSNSPEYLNEDSERGQLKLEVGVSVSQAIPLDTYYTTVIVTASAY